MALLDYEVGSDNVFADLGLDNAEELKTKTLLLIEIRRIVKKKKLKQIDIADLFNIPQPKVSKLLSGKSSGFSTDRLMHFLTVLDQDVNISVKPKPKSRAHAHIVVSLPRESSSIAAKNK
jgi:predicted XRE-type DNA-binding protein